MVERRADLADAAANALDGTSADDDQAFFIAVRFADAAQILVERELFAWGDDNAKEIGGGTSDIMFARIR